MSFLLNSASIITCPHGGKISVKPFYGITHLVDGKPVCVKEDAYSINGCPMKTQCHSVKWMDDSSVALLYGRFQILTNTSIGVCFDLKNFPTGNAKSVAYQTKISLESYQDSFKTKW